MSRVEIIDENGNKVSVDGIYYVSNNNYYFIYTKEELDENGHIILYILKILQEVTNTPNGPVPTGYLIGIKVTDEDEYNLVKQDITNIVAEKQNNAEAKVMYLDMSMLQNLKVKDSRIFKLDVNLYNKIFKNNSIDPSVDTNNVSDNQTIQDNNNQALDNSSNQTEILSNSEAPVETNPDNGDNLVNYQEKYEEELRKNEQLQNEIDNLNNILNQIRSIIK